MYKTSSFQFNQLLWSLFSSDLWNFGLLTFEAQRLFLQEQYELLRFIVACFRFIKENGYRDNRAGTFWRVSNRHKQSPRWWVRKCLPWRGWYIENSVLQNLKGEYRLTVHLSSHLKKKTVLWNTKLLCRQGPN